MPLLCLLRSGGESSQRVDWILKSGCSTVHSQALRKPAGRLLVPNGYEDLYM